MIGSLSKFGFCVKVFLFLCVLVTPGAQETTVNVKKLLEDALYLLIDVDVGIPNDEINTWETKVEKITVLGRPVGVNLAGENSRLKVGFTFYPAEGNTLLLVARSEIWIGSEYSSALTSLTVGYRDAMYYYPLGRSSGLNVEVRMTIEVIPYLDTLSKENRDAIESALDSTAQFDLSKKPSEIK